MEPMKKLFAAWLAVMFVLGITFIALVVETSDRPAQQASLPSATSLIERVIDWAMFRPKPEQPSTVCCLEYSEPICGASAQSTRIESLDYINRIHVQFSEQQQFGIV